MKAVGKQDLLWPALFTASFIVYLLQSQSLRTFVREFVRLVNKVL